MRKPFKDWEKDFIYLAYPEFNSEEIADLLNRSKNVIKFVASELKIKKPKIDLSGEKFGKLLVIKKTIKNKKKKQTTWECLCDCGKTTYCSTAVLNFGHSTSCGCGRIEAIKSGLEEISGTWYGNLKRRATDRDFKFEISKEYLNKLWKKQGRKCALSGLPIKISQIRSGKAYYKENTASLDRIDNTKPYIEGNVQFVHKHINYMKWTHDQDYFISLCKEVVKHQNV